MKRYLGWVVLASLCAAPLALGLHAQQTPTQTPPPDPAEQAPPVPVFRTDINFVRVDVIVSSKQGDVITDLRQQDFEVTEDGKPQAIQTFKLINIKDTSQNTVVEPPRPIRDAIQEQAEAQREDTRLFGIFLDDYHVRLENSMRSRESIATFIENQLSPSDMMAIMYPLTPLTDVMLTHNIKSVAGAVREFVGRKYDYTARNIFEERYVNYVSTMEAERIRNQVTMSALKGFIIKMGGLRDGRKSLILVSEGFTSSMPQQAQDPIAAQPGMPGPTGGGGIVRAPDPMPGTNPGLQARQESIEFFEQASLWSDLKWVTDTANRYNTTIYTVDPRGLAAFEFDLSRSNVSMTKDAKILQNTQDTMRILAEETDGRAIVNQNDLDKGLKQIVKDSSAYYLLGYTSTLAKPDGRFHKIDVKVKRPGLQVRSRRGYLAFTPDEATRALSPPKPGPPKAITEALGALSVPVRRSVIRTWVGMSPGANGKTKVTFLWEPVPQRPGVRAEVPAGVSLVAGSANSDLFYRGRSVAPMGTAAGTPPTRVEFEVPPGPVDLEIAVEDPGKQLIDRETRKIIVPSLGVGLTMSTPQVFRARTVREFQALAVDQAAVPLADREFRRTDRLLLRAAAQSPAVEAPTISARLLNRDGGEMMPLPATPAGFGDLINIDVPLAAFSTGDYLIEINASDGTDRATTLVAFRITP
ncbi:MAG: VWA domain-containing protein [Vicinamibacterales bacterium]|nr:VWA domain-containing protein [Vicinamibacterales bacterium]